MDVDDVQPLLGTLTLTLDALKFVTYLTKRMAPLASAGTTPGSLTLLVETGV